MVADRPDALLAYDHVFACWEFSMMAKKDSTEHQIHSRIPKYLNRNIFQEFDVSDCVGLFLRTYSLAQDLNRWAPERWLETLFFFGHAWTRVTWLKAASLYLKMDSAEINHGERVRRDIVFLLQPTRLPRREWRTKTAERASGIRDDVLHEATCKASAQSRGFSWRALLKEHKLVSVWCQH